jgi:hypothetical protein
VTDFEAKLAAAKARRRAAVEAAAEATRCAMCFAQTAAGWSCASCKRPLCSLSCIERHAIVVDHRVKVETIFMPRPEHEDAP